MLDCRNAGDDVDWRANLVVCSSSKSGTYSLDFSNYKEEGMSAKQLLRSPADLAKAKLVAVTWEPIAPETGKAK